VTFLDEEDRQGAVRVATRAVVRAGIALFATVASPLVALMFGPVFGVVFGVAAIGLAASSLNTLRHPQASVVGGLRVLGLVLAGIVILIGVLEVALAGWRVHEWRQNAELTERVDGRAH
jgi:hypothetical protein